MNRHRNLAMVGLLTVAILGLGSFALKLDAANPNPIQIENQNPGTGDWSPTNVADNHEIEGYASLTSVNAGSPISFFVNAQDPQYTEAVYRLGYYQGLGGRQMTTTTTFTSVVQPAPTQDPNTGMIECNWTHPLTLTIPSNWVSGIYVVKLTGVPSGKQRLISFVVRNDGRQSDLMFQNSATTAQAYNAWGGKSLYDYNSTGGTPALKVSFNRPYDDSEGAGEILSWELNMLVFLEKEGYDVVYSTDVDTHESPSQLLLHKGFLSVGHDEYWSWEMRQNVTAARDKGVSLGFFGANICYWQIRFETSPVTGASDRTIVCYKALSSQDPAAANPATYYLVTTRWRDTHVTLPANPEDSFIGIMSNPDEPVDGNITITAASSWVFANTGLQAGSMLQGLLGYEVDELYNDGNAPAGIVDLAHSSYVFTDGTTQHSDMTVYTAGSGATVFAAGSIQWSEGLSDVSPWSPSPSRLNVAAQQTTRNVLAKFISSSGGSPSPTPTATPSVGATPTPVATPVPTPVVQLNPAQLTFSSVEVGRSQTSSITVSNTGKAPLVISGVSTAGDYTQSNSCSSPVAPTKSCSISVTFQPTVIGDRPGTLTIIDNASGGQQLVHLDGTGISKHTKHH
jgi:hypothetical protein